MSATHHVCQALLRPQTFLGCDRELAMTLTFFCVGLSTASADPYVAGMALITFLTGIWLLRLMARHDLLLRHVYLRQLRYRRFYRAAATVLSPTFRKYT